MPLLLWSCTRENEDTATGEKDPVVAEIGDSCLLRHDVVRRIPGGLPPADSAAMFEAIVNAWTDRLLLREFATENIGDLARIETMVDEYRTRLIINAYRKSMREKEVPEISSDSIRNHYESHADDYILERPLVKGIYIKLPDTASALNDIRHWMQSDTPDAIDRLERDGLSEALQYSFFEDKWIDFRIISEQIPYRFFDQNAFVEAHRDFETSYSGLTYILHISDYIPAGEKMPFEFAEPLIRESLAAKAVSEYEMQLMKSIRAAALRDGRLKYHKEK